MTTKPERLEGRVRDLVQSGEGAVETARGVLLVRGVLPDEVVALEIHPKERKGRARLLKVVSPSSARILPVCPYVSRCGGCALMHADAALQASTRTGFLESALRRAGVLESVVVQHHPAARALQYRRRARLAFSVRGQERLLGFRREGRHELVDVAHCAVVSPVLDAALTRVREHVLPALVGEGELRVYEGAEGRAVAVLNAAEAQSPALYASVAALVGEHGFAGAAIYANSPAPAVFGDARVWTTDAMGAPLVGTLAGFSQAHSEVNTALVARVLELAAPAGARVLELYAGHGNLTVSLAPGSLAYTALERDAPAVAALRENAKQRGLDVKAVVADVAQYKRSEPVDVVVLDPPRTGQRGLLTALALQKPKRIVYVSCDPATLARDLSEVCGKGYRLATADAFDMFPQTAELECVVSLVRG